MEPNQKIKKEKKKLFLYEGITYTIDFSKKVDCIGDFFENAKIIYIDKNIPEKFHEGIAVHEIEERKIMKKGYSYGWSHNQAQKKEFEFYKKTLGDDEGKKIIAEEEELTYNIFLVYTQEDLKKLKKRKKNFSRFNIGFKE